MRADETPFPAGWWGQDLGVRPRVGTYGRYPYDKLPTLPFDLRGDFEWLLRQPSRGDSIAKERESENVKSLGSLLEDAEKRGLVLPAEFVEYFRSTELQQRVRSCTDCFLDLSRVAIMSPLSDGFLVRFLADSQSCVFWYLYQLPGALDHCVVASPDFYGAPAEQWETEPPDPDEITFCEESFERFMCRFWLENEIFYSRWERQVLFPEGRQYIESYARSS